MSEMRWKGWSVVNRNGYPLPWTARSTDEHVSRLAAEIWGIQKIEKLGFQIAETHMSIGEIKPVLDSVKADPLSIRLPDEFPLLMWSKERWKDEAIYLQAVALDVSDMTVMGIYTVPIDHPKSKYFGGTRVVLKGERWGCAPLDWILERYEEAWV